MIDDGFMPTPEELEQRHQATLAMQAYDTTAPIVYLGQDGGFRNPTSVERLTNRIFSQLAEKVSLGANDDGSLIYEKLWPIDLGNTFSITRAFSHAVAPRVQDHIWFSDSLINYYGTYHGDSNGSLFSEPDGSLVRVSYTSASREGLPLPCVPRVALATNLIALALKNR